MSARDRVLQRVRSGLEGRAVTEHPGDFEGWRPTPAPGSPLDGFEALFKAAGGEVVRRPDTASAGSWIAAFAEDFGSAAFGESVPDPLKPHLKEAPPEVAELGVSMARAAVAETGSLVIDARDGRRPQLLAPTHVVFVREGDIHATVRHALASMRNDLPSAIGLHSGPSKSADIGQIMVKGVHGPGRVVAVVIEERRHADGE